MDLIGSMYHTVAVLTNAGGTLGAGGQDNYSELLTTRGKLDQSGGGRGDVLGIIQGSDSVRITVRFQDAIWNAVTMSMKLRVDGVTYTVQSWKRINDNRKGFIEFNVTTNAQ